MDKAVCIGNNFAGKTQLYLDFTRFCCSDFDTKLLQAEDALLEGNRRAPDDPWLLNALAVLYAQRGEPRLALPYARRMLELAPDAPDVRRFVERLEADAR